MIGHTKDVRSPIKNIGSTSFMYIRVGGVSFLVAISLKIGILVSIDICCGCFKTERGRIHGVRGAVSCR